jgi:hypothetical protein
MSRYMAGRSLVAALYAAVDRADLASLEWYRIASLICEHGGVGGDKQ